MRHLLIVIALGACGVASLAAQSSIISFYPIARAETANPPPLDSLVVLCRQKIEYQGNEGWLTLAGRRGGEALVVIDGKIKELPEAISLVPVSTAVPVGTAIPPTALPGPNGTLDWGYLWDRNGDGRADYLAYLDGALFVLPDTVPADFPVVVSGSSALGGPGVTAYFGWPDKPLPASREERGKDFPVVLGQWFGSLAIHRDALPFLERSVRMVFYHYADDNFDGLIEGAVVPERDSVRMLFVGWWTVFRSSRGDGTVDQAWSFRSNITDTLGLPSPIAGDFVWWSTFSANPMPAREPFERGAMLLTLTNEAVKGCGSKVHLRRE
jgi:hypothetical protein